MSTWTAPERILSYGTISVTWHRANPREDIVISYPEPKPPTIYPAGIEGWWRPTSEWWGQFLPDGETGAGVAMLSAGLDISGDFEQVTYNLSPFYYDEDDA